MQARSIRELIGAALIGALAALMITALVPGVQAAVGDPIRAGERTTSTAQTRLWAVAGNSALKVTNKLSGHPALWLEVRDVNTPPMRVSSPARVDNLNADLLDGVSSEGLLGATYKVTAGETAPGPGMEDVMALCNPGDVVIGGGYETASIHPDVRPITNAPHRVDTEPQGWLVTIINESSVDVDFWSIAICAPGSTTW